MYLQALNNRRMNVVRGLGRRLIQGQAHSAGKSIRPMGLSVHGIKPEKPHSITVERNKAGGYSDQPEWGDSTSHARGGKRLNETDPTAMEKHMRFSKSINRSSMRTNPRKSQRWRSKISL